MSCWIKRHNEMTAVKRVLYKAKSQNVQ